MITTPRRARRPERRPIQILPRLATGGEPAWVRAHAYAPEAMKASAGWRS